MHISPYSWKNNMLANALQQPKVRRFVHHRPDQEFNTLWKRYLIVRYLGITRGIKIIFKLVQIHSSTKALYVGLDFNTTRRKKNQTKTNHVSVFSTTMCYLPRQKHTKREVYIWTEQRRRKSNKSWLIVAFQHTHKDAKLSGYQNPKVDKIDSWVPRNKGRNNNLVKSLTNTQMYQMT